MSLSITALSIMVPSITTLDIKTQR
jgi:hypothetical protein